MSLIIMEKDSFWSYRDNLILITLGTPECLDIMTSRHISLCTEQTTVMDRPGFQNECLDENAFRKTEI